MVRYKCISVTSGNDYEVGKDGVQSIERESGKLLFTVRYEDGATKEHRSQEIVEVELTEEEERRLL